MLSASRRIGRRMDFLLYFFSPAVQFVTTVSRGDDAAPVPLDMVIGNACRSRSRHTQTL